MSELAATYVSVLPETSRLAPEVKKAFGEADTYVQRQTDGWGKKFSAAATKWAKRATIAGAAITAGLSIKGGISRLMAIDEAEAKMRGLGFSSKAIAQISDNALAAVKGTAFGLGDAMSGAAAAITSGIKPGKELTDYLTVIANTATLGGSSFNEMGTIIGKTTARGKVGMENLNQLMERQIPILDWLADHYGVSGEELSKMVSQGEVDAATFRKVLQDNVGTAAQEAGKTVRGSFANMTAGLGRVAANVLGPVFEQLAPTMQRITTALEPLEEQAKVVGPILGSAFANVADGVAAAIPPTREFAGWLADQIGPFLSDIGSVLNGVVIPALSSLASGFRDGEGSGGALATVLRGIVTAGKNVTEWLADHRTIVWAVIAAYAAYKVITKTLATYRAIIATITAAKQAYALATYGQAAADSTGAVRAAAFAGALKVKTAAVWASTTAMFKNLAVNVKWQILLARQGIATLARSTAAWIANTASVVANRVATAAVKAVWAGGWLLGQVAVVARSTAAWAANNIALGVAYARAAAVTVATKAQTIAQRALNLAMRANPLGLVITALTALAAAAVFAYKRSDTFRAIVNRVWADVQRIISFAWKNVIRPIFSAYAAYLTKVLFPVIRFLWNNVIRPVFGFIAAHIQRQVGIGMAVFRTFRSGVGKVADAFASARDGIRRAWNKLGDVVSGPVNTAKRVISGFIELINKIPGVEIPNPFKGSGIKRGTANNLATAGGGRTQAFATGGPVRGPGTGTSDSILARLSNGEHVLTADDVRALGGHARILALRAAARAGQLHLPGFRDGGPVVPGRGNQHSRAQYPWATYAGDFPNPIGTPVRAWKSGVIALVRSLTTSYGNHIRMNHGDGTSSLYAHLSSFAAAVGDRVKQGQIIGRVGSTGNSTGPHLHLELMGGLFRGLGSAAASVWDTLQGAGGRIGKWIREKLVAKADIGGLFGNVGGLFSDVGNSVKDHVLDDLFDSGGVARGAGYLPKKTIAPERVLSPRQTVAFERMSKEGFGGRQGGTVGLLTITNWDEGTGYFEAIAQDEAEAAIDNHTEHAGQLQRMGAR